MLDLGGVVWWGGSVLGGQLADKRLVSLSCLGADSLARQDLVKMTWSDADPLGGVAQSDGPLASVINWDCRIWLWHDVFR